jgi:flagellar biosynthesis component FlhA
MDFKETVYYSVNWINMAKGQAPVAGTHIVERLTPMATHVIYSIKSHSSSLCKTSFVMSRWGSSNHGTLKVFTTNIHAS